MSTSWLYHGFGVRGYRYVATRYEDGAIVMRIEVAARVVSVSVLWEFSCARRRVVSAVVADGAGRVEGRLDRDGRSEDRMPGVPHAAAGRGDVRRSDAAAHTEL